ncbi:MAG: SMI1/KNR4 family protein [Lysobacter sp.]|nr:SMI1/KNR4 family protein [Lysobacter sp.]
MNYQDELQRLGGVTRATADAFAPLDPFAIRQLERRIGFELPQDYRDFLVRLGGGLDFKEEVASEPLRDRPEYLHAADTGLANPTFAGSIVATFFGADERLPAHLGFDWALRNYEGRLPDRSLPVATDGAGNLVCLIDARERRPGYYWWDHENEWDQSDYRQQTGKAMPAEAKYQNVYFIAESFSRLLQRAFVFVDD